MSQTSEKRLWIVTVYLTLPASNSEEARAFLLNNVAPLLSEASHAHSNVSRVQLRGAQFGNATKTGMPVSAFLFIESDETLTGPVPDWLEAMFTRMPNPVQIQGFSSVSPVIGS